MQHDLICSICNAGFQSTNGKRKTCGRICNIEAIRRYRLGKPTVTTTYRGKPIFRNEQAGSFEAYCMNAAFKLTKHDTPRIPGSENLNQFGMYSRTNKTGLVRDHMFSRRQGFLENVPADVIGHAANCQFISMRENSAKADNCCITLDQLYERMQNWHAAQPVQQKDLFRIHKRTRKASTPKEKKPKSYKSIDIYRDGKTKIITANQFCAYKKCGWSRDPLPS